MARVNARSRAAPAFTHEGGPASANIPNAAQLRRLVMACMLWEDQFYVDGEKIADQIEQAAMKVAIPDLIQIMFEARNVAQLRHVPLLLADILTKRAPNVAGAVAGILQRADEPGELIALHLSRKGILNANKSKTLPSSIRKGIELALQANKGFGEYGLAKYDRDSKVKLRDVLRLVRPKPLSKEQSRLWKRVIAGTLDIPDTWETALSGGADKKETFERMLREGTLGYLALLRNLRNMEQAGVDRKLVNDAILLRKGSARVLPFRYVAAARAAPSIEKAIDQALVASVGESAPLPGRTAVVVDVSGSMKDKLSEKSDLTRLDAAAALASVINGDLRVFTFSNRVVEVPARRGMAGVDAIKNSQQHAGTYLGQAVQHVNNLGKHERIIVITDEQSRDKVPEPIADKAYMINVASYQNGIGYAHTSKWVKIDGFSEGVIRFIREYEAVTKD